MKVIRTKHGVRMTQGGAVLSEIRAEPGPTDSVFDLLAASIAACCDGGSDPVALLGFAGGGLVAPLRAMGCGAPISAVDLDPRGAELFRDVSGDWTGDVGVAIEDAARWLRRARRSWQVILEDLSELGTEGETKPAVTVTALPELIDRRLRKDGVAIINLLPVPGVSWRVLQRQASAPWRGGLVVYIDEFENRVLVTGRRALAARDFARDVRERLDAIGSELAGGFHVRALRR